MSGANSDAVNYSSIVDYELPRDHPPVDVSTFFAGARKFRTVEVEVFRDLYNDRQQRTYNMQHPRHSLQGRLCAVLGMPHVFLCWQTHT